MNGSSCCALTGATLPPGHPEPPFLGWHLIGAADQPKLPPKNPAQVGRKLAQQAGQGSLITLFTDAGFCPQTKRASWAAWAKMDGQTLRRAGIQKDDATGSDVAELRALVNGVYLVLTLMKPAPGSRIIAQTDSMSAINALAGPGFRNREARQRVQPMVKTMRGLLSKAGLTINYRHVKGHKGHVTPRNSVNTWCDGECRRWLREARTQAGYTNPNGRNTD